MLCGLNRGTVIEIDSGFPNSSLNVSTTLGSVSMNIALACWS